MPPAWRNCHLVWINNSQLCFHPSITSCESPVLDYLGSCSLLLHNSSIPASSRAWGRQCRKQHRLCLTTETAFSSSV